MAETEINWPLIQQLAEKPHKHLNITTDGTYGVMLPNGDFDTGCGGVGEVMNEARTVQHLCDMAGIPEGRVYDAHIDARVFQLLLARNRLAERLDRLSSWHSRETAPGGMVGDYCNECGNRWPCATRRMADGTYKDEDEPAETPNVLVPLPGARLCGGQDLFVETDPEVGAS